LIVERFSPPEIWLGPDEHLGGRYPALVEWIRARYQDGACVYSACSGALMLAETGLSHRLAGTHVARNDMQRESCHDVVPPAVTMRPSGSAKQRLGSGRNRICG
jgi:hypothetical protein